MFEAELIFGLAIFVVVLMLNFAPKGKIKVNLKIPSLGFLRKNVAKKIEEIDKQLEEVVSATTLPKEKIVKLEDATEEVAKKFEIKGDLLSEMHATNVAKESEVPKNDEAIPLPSPETGDLDKIKFENEIKLEQSAETTSAEAEKVEKIEFEESDKLLEDIAKEVEKKEEEEIDLLRDLKGQKFSVKELEKELSEVLSIAKRLAK
ncbi:MAG: hypothetical protein QXN27_03230 [Archaeoglobaceae archaeon]|uniref:Uncharacterized protein n=1 Tax=Archaeoglobus fulgidus TaxID=2234 RepID=A0A7J3M2B1_ARCFL